MKKMIKKKKEMNGFKQIILMKLRIMYVKNIT